MSSYLALQIPHQKVISFKTTFQPERVVYTPVNRNLLFTKICWYNIVKMLRYRYIIVYLIFRYFLHRWLSFSANRWIYITYFSLVMFIPVPENILELYEPVCKQFFNWINLKSSTKYFVTWLVACFNEMIALIMINIPEIQ